MGYFWFVYILFVVGATSHGPGDREISVVTWNVNGVKKFRHLPHEVSFLGSHDIVLLQETFAKDDVELFELRGYYSHHTRALPRPGCRNVWGLSSFFRTLVFADGFWVKIFSPADWILVSRWKPSHQAGIVVVNVYVPVHTAGFAAYDIQILRSTVEDLVTTYPGDFFIICGDFNFDRFESNSLRSGMAK